MEKLTARWIEILSDRTGDIVTVCKWLSGPDVWLTATEALEFGLVDEIISRPAALASTRTKEPTIPIEAPAEPAAPMTAPAPEGNDALLLDFLKAFGEIQTADKSKLFRELSVWFGTNVREAGK